MEGGNSDSIFLNSWQKLYFESKKEDPSKKSDAIRGMLHKLSDVEKQQSGVKGNLSEKIISSIKSDLLLRYSSILDDFNSDKGLNNYADQALNLVKNQVNESHRWKCKFNFKSEHMKKSKNLELDISADDLACFNSVGANGFHEIVSDCKTRKIVHDRPSNKRLHSSLTQTDQTKTVCSRFTNFSYEQSQSSSRNGRYDHRSNQRKNYLSSRDQFVPKTCDSDDENEEVPQTTFSFKTAKQQLIDSEKKKNFSQNKAQAFSYGSNKKTLGTRAGVFKKFVPPVPKNNEYSDSPLKQNNGDSIGSKASKREDQSEIEDEKLKNFCPKMVELIKSEIMDHGPPIAWDDIAGLEFAKSTIKEIVVWPMLRPDLFTGLRGPPKGILLFGPPGTGKTLIGKCVASQSKATFFNISASSLTSKWIGDGEKMVRALFAVARINLPAVIFIDEIDSILTQRSESEHESSRRLKTEFLVQLDGAATNSDERILIIGATNRPQELDEAARRRLVKRLYIPLPESCARRQIVEKLLKSQIHNITDSDFDIISELTNGYSGADMTSLCKEASLGPIRDLCGRDIQSINIEEVRPISLADFQKASKQVRASVSTSDLELYLKWNESYGSGSI